MKSNAIVQAARVSYGKGTKSTRDDEKLIRYLMRNEHMSPFEMLEIKLHVKLPIFVARQWIRHRTASVNEYSARYSVVENEFYLPAAENLKRQSTSNKQGREEQLGEKDAEIVRERIVESNANSFENYAVLLGDHEATNEKGSNRGISRELARMVLPLNTYTQWYWKTNLRNLLHFLRLRLDAHAQYEIREYAKTIAEIVAMWVPATYAAFRDYEMESARLSSQAISFINDVVAKKNPNHTAYNISDSELLDLQRRFSFLQFGP